jgi:hypothetical protein
MYDEILFLEATGNYVTFVLNDKKVLARSTFAEAIHWLPQQKFIRVHRSYRVALPRPRLYRVHHHTQRQPEGIDDEEQFMASKISDCQFQVAFKHRPGTSLTARRTSMATCYRRNWKITHLSMGRLCGERCGAKKQNWYLR